MSSKPASAFCDSKSVVRLEDATQNGPWSLWAIGLFVQGRILEDCTRDEFFGNPEARSARAKDFLSKILSN